jgi:hypothetical protein
MIGGNTKAVRMDQTGLEDISGLESVHVHGRRERGGLRAQRPLPASVVVPALVVLAGSSSIREGSPRIPVPMRG